MDWIFLLLWLVAILLIICVVFIVKWRGERRKALVLKEANTMSLQFGEYSNKCFLDLALLSYQDIMQAWGVFHDEFGSSLTALRLSFELDKADFLYDAVDGSEVKTRTLIEDAYNKVRQLDSVVNYDSRVFFDVISQIASKASALKGFTIKVKNFGFFGQLKANVGYLLFFSIKILLANSLNLNKVQTIDISISNKGDMALLVFQVRCADPGKMLSVLKNIKGIEVDAECENNAGVKNCKIIVIVPYI